MLGEHAAPAMWLCSWEAGLSVVDPGGYSAPGDSNRESLWSTFLLSSQLFHQWKEDHVHIASVRDHVVYLGGYIWYIGERIRALTCVR